MTNTDTDRQTARREAQAARRAAARTARTAPPSHEEALAAATAAAAALAAASGSFAAPAAALTLARAWAAVRICDGQAPAATLAEHRAREQAVVSFLLTSPIASAEEALEAVSEAAR